MHVEDLKQIRGLEPVNGTCEREKGNKVTLLPDSPGLLG
jgi:hypothetical protein